MEDLTDLSGSPFRPQDLLSDLGELEGRKLAKDGGEISAISMIDRG